MNSCMKFAIWSHCIEWINQYCSTYHSLQLPFQKLGEGGNEDNHIRTGLVYKNPSWRDGVPRIEYPGQNFFLQKTHQLFGSWQNTLHCANILKSKSLDWLLKSIKRFFSPATKLFLCIGFTHKAFYFIIENAKMLTLQSLKAQSPKLNIYICFK